MEPMRLNKWLVTTGMCSRREADRLIAAGQVLVDGVMATLGQKVTGGEDIMVNDELVTTHKPKPVYLAYNKPVGIICTSDPNAQDNIISAVHYPERVFHIGRLDVASSGLILLTNDGDIVNRILRSEGKHDKEYIVKVDAIVTEDFIKRMAAGIFLDGRKTLPAVVKQLGKHSFRLTLVEGRNRQIRRMCEALGAKVTSLRRIRIMHIELADLPVGQWRHLTRSEVRTLLATA